MSFPRPALQTARWSLFPIRFDPTAHKKPTNRGQIYDNKLELQNNWGKYCSKCRNYNSQAFQKPYDLFNSTVLFVQLNRMICPTQPYDSVNSTVLFGPFYYGENIVLRRGIFYSTTGKQFVSHHRREQNYPRLWSGPEWHLAFPQACQPFELWETTMESIDFSDAKTQFSSSLLHLLVEKPVVSVASVTICHTVLFWYPVC